MKAAPAERSRFLCRRGFTSKKSPDGVGTRSRSDRRQAACLDRLAPAENAARTAFIFVDETSVNTKMVRLRGRSLRGTRLIADAPFGHWGKQTFIAGLRCHGSTAPWVIDKAINRSAFDTWVEIQRAPTLAEGDVVILDNLAAHKSGRAAQCLRNEGAWFLFLPP